MCFFFRSRFIILYILSVWSITCTVAWKGHRYFFICEFFFYPRVLFLSAISFFLSTGSFSVFFLWATWKGHRYFGHRRLFLSATFFAIFFFFYYPRPFFYPRLIFLTATFFYLRLFFYLPLFLVVDCSMVT